jgi:hypothetical protein
MNKRAETFYFLMTMIIVLVVAFLLLTMSKTLGDKLGEQADIVTCKESVELSALTKVGGVQTTNAIKCPTQYVTLYDDDEEKLKKGLAKKMADCFYQFGEGQLELFPLYPGKNTHFCAVCSVIEFDEDAKAQELTGMSKYLLQNNVPNIYGKESYYEYLFGKKPTAKVLQDVETVDDTIDTNNPYSIIYLYDKTGKVGKVFTGSAGAIAGLGLGVATGGVGYFAVGTAFAGGALGLTLGSGESATWSYATALYPYSTESLNELGCEEIAVAQGNK